MVRYIILLALLAATALAQVQHYHGHSVYRVLPKNEFQLSSLLQLQEKEVDFWREPDRINRIADLMVTPNNKEHVEEFLKQRDIEYKVMVEDVESLIQNERQEMRLVEEQLRNKRSGSRAGEAIEGYWKTYQRYDNVNKFMEALEAQNSQLVKKIKFGTSYQNRDLNLVRIGANSNNNKPVVFIEGGIHAREWISPATVTYFAQQLVNGYNDKNATFTSLLDTFDFYIVPVLNVDGYEYTHTNSRLWRKTRRPSASSPSCIGADPNRNFGYKWGGTGASTNPCSETYRGDSAFSENETRAEAEYILANFKGRAKIYLAVHSYGQYWLYPWGWTSSVTNDDAELNSKAKIAAAALNKHYNTKYTIGTSTNVLYAAAGGSDDWAYGNASIKYSYTVELRDTGYYGFQLPASQIVPTGTETTSGIVALVQAVKQTYGL